MERQSRGMSGTLEKTEVFAVYLGPSNSGQAMQQLCSTLEDGCSRVLMRNFYDAEASKQLNSGSCWFLQLHAQIIGDGPCSAIDSDGMEIGDQTVT